MKQFFKRLCIALAVVLVVGACVVAWRVWPRSTVLLTDADAIRVPSEGAVVRDVLWRPAESLPALINTKNDDYEAEISEDGMTLFFVRGRPGENADIFVCHKSDTGWSLPESLGAVNSESDDLGPELTSDGRALYFYSDREGGAGGYDLWLARRGENGWREPVNLGSAVNSQFDEYGPALTPDQGALYFASNRPREGEEQPSDSDAWRATLREDRHVRDFDLFVATLTDAGPQQSRPLVEVNTPADEGAATISPFGDFLYFASNRPGGAGGFDLYRARRVRGAHESPTSLGDTINTPANEMDPELSLGGYGLHFSSDRRLQRDSGSQTANDYNIYYSASREVFREIETQSASIDWAALWRSIGPNLLWGLLALLLLALLAALMRDFKDRRLSLLARCLFASLMAHMLLMLLFNVWQVGSAVASAFNGRSKIQVSLVSAAVGEQIFSQVRGDFTEIAALTPTMETIERTLTEVPQPVLIEPIAPVQVTTPEDSASRILETRQIQSRPIEDATIPARAIAQLDSSVLPERVEEAPSEIDEIGTPGESARESVTESANAPFVEAAAPSVVRPILEIATTQPVMERVDLAIEDAQRSDNPEANSNLLRDLSETTRDARVTAANVSMDDSTRQPISAVDKESIVASSEIGLPATSDVTTRVNDETPVAIPSVVASVETPRADAALPMGEASDTPNARVEFAPTADPVTIREGSVALGNAMADSIAPSTAPVSAGEQPVPVENATSAMSDLALALPSADTTATAAVSSESSPVVAPKAIQGLHADVGIAESASSAIDPGKLEHIAPQGTSLADQKSLVAGGVSTQDASSTAPAGRPASDSPIAVVASDMPAFEIALPSDLAGVLPPDAVGIIRGRVLDAETQRPLGDAVVRLVLSDNRTIEAPSSDGGGYSLYVPPMPDFFALSASHAGYVPKTTNIRADNLSQTPLNVDFELQRQSDPVIALEDQPDVHHLGNDLFEGKINSKFQREAEGRTFISMFQVTREQLNNGYSRAEIRLMARGVQCSHPMRINGRLVRNRIDASPTDGSFGEFAAEFDPAWLIEGENSFKIRAQSCRGDLDDFEFVNIQVRFLP